VNLKGEVIGISSAINPAGQGIGFAIPSSMAITIISQIREKGKVVRGWIGVAVQSITPEIAQAFGLKDTGGALVSEVVPGGPAENAGIKRGDVIVFFNGKGIANMPDLPRIVAETPVDKTVNIKVIREKKELSLQIKTAELTEEKLAYQGKKTEEVLGLSVDNITPKWRSRFGIREKTGVVVIEVLQGGAAEKSGIAPGDIIKEVNHTAVNNLSDYKAAIMKNAGGKADLFLISRAGSTFFATITVS
jgi:serine protease Do